MKPSLERFIHPAAVARSFARQAAVTLLTAAVVLTLGTPPARAATAISNTWDPGHTGTFPGSGGNGVWDLTTANWIQFSGSDSAYRNSSSGATYFEGTAGTVNLNASGVIATGILIYTAGYVLQDAPGTSYALTINNGGIGGQNTSGTVTFALPATMTGSASGALTAVAGGTLAVTGNLTANNGLFVGGGSSTSGTVVLSGNNAITGATTVGDAGSVLQLAGTGTNQPLGGTSSVSVIEQGTLLYEASNQIPAATPVTLNNGTFNVNGQSQDRAHALGALTLSNSYGGTSSALDFGTGLSTGSVLAFGNSSGTSWSGSLSVYDYRGTPTVGGGTDQLFFGIDATGLSATQLGEISFYSGGAGSTLLGMGMILADGEVTYIPVPEPATWLGGALLLGVIAAGLSGSRQSVDDHGRRGEPDRAGVNPARRWWVQAARRAGA